MFDVYIKYWKKADGTIDKTGWKNMFSIPSTGGIPIINPSVKCSEDSADSFDFNVEPGTPYYDSLAQLTTLLRVEYDGDVIFYGRVLTVSGSTVYQTRSIHCEGSMAFLNDTYYEGKPDKQLSKISWSTYLNRILTNHNSMLAGSDGNTQDSKIFSIGTIGDVVGETVREFVPTTEEKKFEPTGWSQSSSMLSSMKDEFGGHMYATYDAVNDRSFLNWYRYYRRDLGDGLRPVISIGKNLLDITRNDEIDNLFTRVIPIGKEQTDNSGDKLYIDGYSYFDQREQMIKTHNKKYMPVDMVYKLYTDQQLNDEFHNKDDYRDAEKLYGIVYKTLTYEDGDTKEKLWNKCAEWIKTGYYGAVSTFDIKAVDTHMVNTELPKILLGECVDVYYRIMENGSLVNKYRKLICKSAKYDLLNPENGNYTFGIPTDLLKISKSQKENEKTSGTSGSGKKTVSKSLSTPKGGDGEDPDKTLTFQDVANIIRADPNEPNGNGMNGWGGDAAADSFLANGEMTGTASVYDYSNGFYSPLTHPEIVFQVQIIGQITIPGKSTKWVAFSESYGLLCYNEYDKLLPDWAIAGISVKDIVDKGLSLAESAFNLNVPKPVTHWYIESGAHAYGSNLVGSGKTSYHSYGKMEIQGIKDKLKASAAGTTRTVIGSDGTISMYDINDPDQATTYKKAIVANVSEKLVGAVKLLLGKSAIPEDRLIDLDGAHALIDIYKEDKAGSTQDQDKTIRFKGSTGKISGVGVVLGKDVRDTSSTITQDGATGTSKYFKFNNDGTVNTTPTVSIINAVGSLLGINVRAGKDGTGDKVTIDQNGSTGKVSVYDPSTVGVVGTTPVKTVEQDGASGGSISAGSGGDLNGWKVTLNKPLTYTWTDGGGESHTNTVPAGSLAADDIHFTKKYDSLRAKLLVVDVLLADYAKIGTLESMKAKIDNLTATHITTDDITANTYVNAYYTFTNTMYFQHLWYQQGSNISELGGYIFNQWKFVENNGSITLQGKSPASSNPNNWYTLASFNISATAKYIADVAQARSDGRGDVYVSGNHVFVDAGATKTVYLKYNDGTEHDTGKSFTVTAGDGGGGDDWPNYIYATTYSSPQWVDDDGIYQNYQRAGGVTVSSSTRNICVTTENGVHYRIQVTVN